MRQTWRWFGPADTVQIVELLQVGVEGLVSALHHYAPGEIWPVAEIRKRQEEVATLSTGAPSGLAWEVVESLPVSEAIKTQCGDWKIHIENYRQSLRNLAQCGLKTVCYNFMPILDWTRTALRSPMPHGGSAMRFDLIDFAVFDIHVLQRPNASDDFTDGLVVEAEQRFKEMGQADRDTLSNNIVAGLPGANDNWTLDHICQQLATYNEIDADRLRANLITFLEAVIPTAEEAGINLCCHPDDPPFSLLGLPRIMSTIDDYAQIMRAVDHRANGITLCTGSMGVLPDVDFAGFVESWGSRIHFVHLRNTARDAGPFADKYSFHESAHLEGDTDMVAVIGALLKEEKSRQDEGRSDWQIPMRPDHGHEILHDIAANSMPGYPLLGRMRGLAELRGIMCALDEQA